MAKEMYKLVIVALVRFITFNHFYFQLITLLKTLKNEYFPS